MRAVLLLLLLPLLTAAQCATRDNPCAAALEKYARALADNAEQMARHNKSVDSVTTALDAAAARFESQTRAMRVQAELMKTWKCSPDGLPMTPALLPTPGLLDGR